METGKLISHKIAPLYKVSLIADGKDHFYEIENDPVWKPGVTTVLKQINKPALIPWACKVMGENISSYLSARPKDKPFTPEEIEALVKEGKQIYKKKAEAAADIGTRAHKAIDSILAGVDVELSDDIKPCVQAFLDWKGRQGVTFELGDTRIASKVFGYGGSLDALAFHGDKVILIDFKTSKGIWDEMAFQVAAYAQAFKETYGVTVSDALILRLGKDTPDFEVKRISNLPACLEGFLAALKLHNLAKWKKFEDPMEGKNEAA